MSKIFARLFLATLALGIPSMTLGHQGISFQSRIFRPDGNLLNLANQTVNIKVLTPSGCVLSDQNATGVDIVDGYLNLVIGKHTVTAQDPGKTMKEIMSNSKNITGLRCLDADNNEISTGQTYIPSAGDARKVRITLDSASDDFIMDFNLRSAAFAVNSDLLNGKGDSEFLQVNAAQGATQAQLESVLSRYATLNSVLSGTYPGLSPLASLSLPSPLDATKYLRGDGTWATISGGGGSVTYGTTAGTAAEGNDSRIVGAFQANTALSGDLSGTLPSPAVEKIKGQSISATGSGAGQVLRYAGANTWTPAFVSMFDLRSTVTGAQAFGGVGCLAGQTLTWTAATDNLSCTNISITKSQISDFPTLAASATTDTTNASNISSGTLDAARLPSSVSNGLWTESSGSVYRSTGNVGIGTNSPAKALHVVDASGAGGITYESTYSGVSGAYGIYRHSRAGASVAVNDYVGGVYFQGMTSDNATWGNAGSIIGQMTNVATGTNAGDLILNTTTAGVNTEKMRVTSSGNVGIGTATPATVLDVNGTSTFRDTVSISGFMKNLSLNSGNILGMSKIGVNIFSPTYQIDVNPNGGGAYASASVTASTPSINGGIRVRNSDPTDGNGSFYHLGVVNTAATDQSAYIGAISQNVGYTPEIVIGQRTGAAAYNERLRIDKNGNVGIGLTSPDEKLVVFNGSTTGKYTTAGWTHSSDARLKHDIIPIENSLEKILKLQGVEYKFNSDPEERTQIGFIAQQVEPIFPEVVVTDDKGFKSMIYSNLVAPLVEAVKTLYNRIVRVEDHNLVQDEQMASQARQIASKADHGALEATNAKIQRLEAENAAKSKELEALKAYLCSKDPASSICK